MSDAVEPHRSSLKPVATDDEDADADADADAGKSRDVSNVRAYPSTRVTIAWPFSQIKLQEASTELMELAGLLSDLLDALAEILPEDRLAPLRDRVEALQTRLH